jgi:hypothetical protein
MEIETNIETKDIRIDSLLFEKKRNGKKNNENTIIEPKIPKKRIITTNDKWIFDENELVPDKQLEYVRELYNDKIISEKSCNFIKQQIQQKLSSYKSQDLKKKKYNIEKMINNHEVLELMLNSENLCFYCKEKVYVLYENVREPKQWTLERIDNDFGHNKDNVVVSCLSCNLKRRTMYYERFLFTKQMNIIKTQDTKELIL